MTTYVIYTLATGAPISAVRGTAEAPDLTDRPELGCFEAADDLDLTPDTWLIVDGGLSPRVFTLAENRQKAVNAAIAYAGALTVPPNGFTCAGVLYQVDQTSQSNIAAMSLMALASIADPAATPWRSGFYWIASDNSHVPMDAGTMLAFGHAVGSYVSACVLRLRTVKDAIAAAGDQAALDAIDVTAGYPSPTG